MISKDPKNPKPEDNEVPIIDEDWDLEDTVRVGLDRAYKESYEEDDYYE